MLFNFDDALTKREQIPNEMGLVVCSSVGRADSWAKPWNRVTSSSLVTPPKPFHMRNTS